MGRLGTTERLITAPSPHTTLAVQSDHSNNWLLYTQPVPSSSPGDRQAAAPLATTSNNGS